MATSEYQVKYNGSIVWLIFWTIIFFPVAIMLFLTGAYFRSNDTLYTLHYPGSRFWLGFWIIVFFPIAILLLIAKGCTWTKVSPERENFVVKADE
jgi:heme/copper-type cytochrome/quinol oxidase subunit 2